jgi:hypothetical protein
MTHCRSIQLPFLVHGLPLHSGLLAGYQIGGFNLVRHLPTNAARDRGVC